MMPSSTPPIDLGARFEDGLPFGMRRRFGIHYTSEPHVLRVLRPLFLDALASELVTPQAPGDVRPFLERLSGLAFLDPASGAGNFLLVAYRELRRLEREALLRLRASGRGALSCNV